MSRNFQSNAQQNILPYIPLQFEIEPDLYELAPGLKTHISRFNRSDAQGKIKISKIKTPARSILEQDMSTVRQNNWLDITPNHLELDTITGLPLRYYNLSSGKYRLTLTDVEGLTQSKEFFIPGLEVLTWDYQKKVTLTGEELELRWQAPYPLIRATWTTPHQSRELDLTLNSFNHILELAGVYSLYVQDITGQELFWRTVIKPSLIYNWQLAANHVSDYNSNTELNWFWRDNILPPGNWSWDWVDEQGNNGQWDITALDTVSIPSGRYTVTAPNQDNFLPGQQVITILEPASYNIETRVINLVGNNLFGGQIIATLIKTSTDGYDWPGRWQWFDEQGNIIANDTNRLTGQPPGTYTVTWIAADNIFQGSNLTAKATIPNSPALIARVTNIQTPNDLASCQGGSVTLNIDQGTEPYSLVVDGQTIEKETNNTVITWPWCPGSGGSQLRLTDNQQQIWQQFIPYTLPSPGIITIIGQLEVGHLCSDGWVYWQIQPQENDYQGLLIIDQVLWSDGSTANPRYDMPAGAYRVTITDNWQRTYEDGIVIIDINPQPCEDNSQYEVRVNNLQPSLEFQWQPELDFDLILEVISPVTLPTLSCQPEPCCQPNYRLTSQTTNIAPIIIEHRGQIGQQEITFACNYQSGAPNIEQTPSTNLEWVLEWCGGDNNVYQHQTNINLELIWLPYPAPAINLNPQPASRFNLNDGQLELIWLSIPEPSLEWMLELKLITSPHQNVIIDNANRLTSDFLPQIWYNLRAGLYELILVNVVGQQFTHSVTILEPPVLAVRTSKTSGRLDWNCLGFHEFQVYSGSPPYNWQWLDRDGVVVSTNSGVTNVPVGRYLYEVTDNTGYTITGNIVLENINTPLPCTDIEDHFLQVTASGPTEWSINKGKLLPSNKITLIIDRNQPPNRGCDLNPCCLDMGVTIESLNPDIRWQAPAPAGWQIQAGNRIVSHPHPKDGEYSFEIQIVANTIEPEYWRIKVNSCLDLKKEVVLEDLITTLPITPLSWSTTNLINPIREDICNGSFNIKIEGETRWPMTVRVQNISRAEKPEQRYQIWGPSELGWLNLCPGTYIVEYYDNLNPTWQTVDLRLELIPPSPLEVMVVDLVAKSDEFCRQGLIAVEISQGLAPYQINWSTGAENVNRITNLAPGDYELEVTDTVGYRSVLNWTIEPLPDPCLNLTEYNYDVANINIAGLLTDCQNPIHQLSLELVFDNQAGNPYCPRPNCLLQRYWQISILSSDWNFSSLTVTNNISLIDDKTIELWVERNGVYFITINLNPNRRHIGSLEFGLSVLPLTPIPDQLKAQEFYTILNFQTGINPKTDLTGLKSPTLVGSEDGEVQVVVTGCYQEPIQWQLNNSPLNNFTRLDESSWLFSKLPAGVYNLTSQDNWQQNIADLEFELLDPEPLRIEILSERNFIDWLCQDGYITLQASGGNPPYDWRWDTGASHIATNPATHYNLSAREYLVTVIDSRDQTLDFNFNIFHRTGDPCQDTANFDFLYEIEVTNQPLWPLDVNEPYFYLSLQIDTRVNVTASCDQPCCVNQPITLTWVSDKWQWAPEIQNLVVGSDILTIGDNIVSWIWPNTQVRGLTSIPVWPSLENWTEEELALNTHSAQLNIIGCGEVAVTKTVDLVFNWQRELECPPSEVPELILFTERLMWLNLDETNFQPQPLTEQVFITVLDRVTNNCCPGQDIEVRLLPHPWLSEPDLDLAIIDWQFNEQNLTITWLYRIGTSQLKPIWLNAEVTISCQADQWRKTLFDILPWPELYQPPAPCSAPVTSQTGNATWWLGPVAGWVVVEFNASVAATDLSLVIAGQVVATTGRAVLGCGLLRYWWSGLGTAKIDLYVGILVNNPDGATWRVTCPGQWSSFENPTTNQICFNEAIDYWQQQWLNFQWQPENLQLVANNPTPQQINTQEWFPPVNASGLPLNRFYDFQDNNEYLLPSQVSGPGVRGNTWSPGRVGSLGTIILTRRIDNWVFYQEVVIVKNSN